jgi:5-methylcytosine-specific restriction endonuclease McrA
MYGRWDEDGEFNPFDGEPDDDPVAEARLLCCNCDSRLRERRYPYLFCSERCAEEAHTVRYVRGTIRDGRINDPEVAEAVRIRIGMVLGGGYAKSARELSPELRRSIVERDGGVCQVCGEPGDQIDHINEDASLVAIDINDPRNLQLICDSCHRAKTLSTFKPLEDEERPHADALRARIDASVPLRECDDDQQWKTLYKTRAAERSALVKEAREHWS